MEDERLDKKIKDILSAPPVFELDREAEKDMLNKLEMTFQPKRRRNFLWLFLPLLLLPLLFGGFFTYRKITDLNAKVDSLNQQISTTQTNTVLNDTIVQKHIVYQYDTIYNVYYKNHYSNNNNQNQDQEKAITAFRNSLKYSVQGLQNLFKNPEPNNYTRWGLDSNKAIASPYYPSSIFSLATSNSSSANSISKIAQQETALLGYIPENILNFNYDYTPKLDESQLPYDLTDRDINPMVYLTPMGLKVKLSTNPYVLFGHNYGGYGFDFGLKGALLFVKNRSLIFGAEYLSTRFELKDDPRFSNFPLINPNDPGDNLHELKVDHSFIQFPVILRQSFRADQKFQPYFNVGLIGNKPLSQKYIYEYIDATGEYKLDATFQQGTFTMNNVHLGLGAEFYFNDKLTLESGIGYQHAFSIKSTNIYALRYWALRLNLNYKLF